MRKLKNLTSPVSCFLKIVLVGLVFLVFVGASLPAKAWKWGEPIVPCTDNCTLCHFFVLINNILDALMIYIAPTVAVIMLTYAGIQLVLAQAYPKKIEKAKQMMKYVVWGLLIIWFSWLIIDFIMQHTVDDWLEEETEVEGETIVRWPWEEIECSNNINP